MQTNRQSYPNIETLKKNKNKNYINIDINISN